MSTKKPGNFSFRFESSQPAEEIFKTLLDVRSWWSGLYGEEIKGQSRKLQDEFSFSAGGGAHYSRQKLVELEPNKKIAWLVTESKLNFLKKPDEWTNTKIIFDLSGQNGKTMVTFTHAGLVPKIECYDGCAGAWTQYLENLSRACR